MNKLILTNDIININKPLLTVKELLNCFNYEYNTLFLDKFWNNIKEDIWIYIDDNMLKYIGYNCERERDSRKKYLNLLTTNFEIDLDYKILNSGEFKNSYSDVTVAIENNEYNEHNKAKHLILSPDCFKQSLMLLKTNKAKEIKKYYIELEKVFKLYLEYQNEYRKSELEKNKLELENKQKELDETKYKVMDMERDFQHTELEFDEFIYIATNENYHKQNVYKIGRSARLNKRTKQFNTFFINGHKIFYIYVFQCHKSRILEQLLFTCLDKYKYCKINELFHLELNKLLSMVFNIGCQYNKIINYTNEFLLSNNEVKILNDDNITSQIFPINYKNNKIDTYDEELLKKYANNKNICNMIAKEFVDFDYEDHILLNNKALSIDTNTKYYYLTYYNKIIYICTNCGCFKKDKRSYEQHIRKRNKCMVVKLNLNTIEDIENELNKQNIKLYSCEKCPETIFKTYDHYKRHIENNCKLIK